MDYQSIHGQDVTSFSSPSQHRMPTKSAAQALQDLQNPVTQTICTGVRALDLAIVGRNVDDDSDVPGGFKRGTVTEVYGPPGVGKTILGLQVAANVLRAGNRVIWVDCANPIPGSRLSDILSSDRVVPNEEKTSTTFGVEESETRACTSSDQNQSTDTLLSHLSHFMAQSLPHLIALLCHTPTSFPAENTALIVIDSLSSLIAAAYPRTQENPTTPQKPGIVPKNDPARMAAARKWPVLQYILTSLKKLAMLRDIAIVILNQTVTRMQLGDGATLVPAISSDAWEAGLTTRMVLFRDWGWEGQEVCFVGVMKAMGTTASGRDGLGKVVAMKITSGGLESVKLPDIMPALPRVIVQNSNRKRKVDEIMDSEDEGDEDYGWEDGEELPPPPPQWQGSEDILVRGLEDGLDDEEGEEDPNALDEAEVDLSDEDT